MWFERLVGFPEETPQQVRASIALEGKTLRSLVNGRALECGQLEIPSLGELRDRVQSSGYRPGKISVREEVADVRRLHADARNAGSLFQVASQFNLLEMAGPSVTPEDGVGIYEHDHTQGPACVIAAGAGTIYRNYFAVVNGQTGQSAADQIDCLADIGAALGNLEGRLWEMRNGYALASFDGLAEIAVRLRVSAEDELDELRRSLRIGVQWDTQVTLDDCRHLVSQAYCSALPVSYSAHASNLWAEFARLVLEAAYEATICAAILNSKRSGNNRVYLTLLGEGAFGNETDWITGAIQRALQLYRDADLDVVIVSYGASNPDVRRLVEQFAL
jgi:hypothetical protein